MQLGLSARDRRTLIVGVSVVGPLFAIGRGLPALTQWQNAQRAEAASVVTELAVARGAARLMPEVRDSLRAREARVAALDSVLLAGVTASAAAAALAAMLEDMADEAAIKVSVMQLHADSAGRGSLVRVGVRLTGVGDVYGLLAFLRAIEGGETLLAVRDLAVSQPEPTAPSSKPETLRLDVLVEALARMSAEKR